MSTHRKCCKCGCQEGQYVRPQPCDDSNAFSYYDEVNEINVSHWDVSCIPYFDCQYIKDALKESETGVISFAFQGACWFFDGRETKIQNWCDIYPCCGDGSPGCFIDEDTGEETFVYGFDLTEGTPLARTGTVTSSGEWLPEEFWSVEGIYDRCEDCFESKNSKGEQLNERWFVFRMCNCENDFDTTAPPPNPGGIGPGMPPQRPPDDDGQLPGDKPCDDDWCVRTFDNRPIYIPFRYMPKLMETDCCVNSIGPCITPPGCDDTSNKCHYWKEPISDAVWDGSPTCCLRSCTCDTCNEPEIVSHIPCNIYDNQEIDECHCLSIWTPYLFHTLLGGEEIQGAAPDDCAFTPVYWNREDARVVEPNSDGSNIKTGARKRGCCSCCCQGYECNVLGNWEYCRAFEGMTNWTIYEEWSMEKNVGGCIHQHNSGGEDALCTNILNGWFTKFCCNATTKIIAFHFTVYPDVPDCIYDGGAEVDCVPWGEMLNVFDCIQLEDVSLSSACEHQIINWRGEVHTNCRDSVLGQIELDPDSAFEDDAFGFWQGQIHETTGNSMCPETIGNCFPSGTNCTDTNCPTGNPNCFCAACCSSNDQGPTCDTLLGDPCCADVDELCIGKPILVTKNCAFSPGGTFGFERSSPHLKWGHYDWCRTPRGDVVGMRVGFAYSSGKRGYPTSLFRHPAWSETQGPSCCTEDFTGSQSCEEFCFFDGCGGDSDGWWDCGTVNGAANCPLTFCFLMPDNRTEASGQCRPIDFLPGLPATMPEKPPAPPEEFNASYGFPEGYLDKIRPRKGKGLRDDV